MMSEEVVTDLKQFITAAISHAMTDVATKDDIEQLNRRVDVLEATVNERFDEVLNAVGRDIDCHDKQLQNHESRSIRLEHTIA